jgi:hypothetical protein
MPAYCFRCPTCMDPETGKALEFTVFLSTVPKKVKQDAECSECGGRAPRAFDLEIPTQAVVGLTPISKSTTTPGSVYHTLKYAFGDSEADPSQAAFRDTGELKAFMNGKNELGKPCVDQRTGQVRRRPDGSIVRQGAKLIQYDKNASPSRDDVRRKPATKSIRFRGGSVSFENGAGGDIRVTS